MPFLSPFQQRHSHTTQNVQPLVDTLTRHYTTVYNITANESVQHSVMCTDTTVYQNALWNTTTVILLYDLQQLCQSAPTFIISNCLLAITCICALLEINITTLVSVMPSPFLHRVSKKTVPTYLLLSVCQI